jgi:hypothetical protein
MDVELLALVDCTHTSCGWLASKTYTPKEMQSIKIHMLFKNEIIADDVDMKPLLIFMLIL